MSRATEAFSHDSSHENVNANKIWLIKVWRICGHLSNIQNFSCQCFPLYGNLVLACNVIDGRC